MGKPKVETPTGEGMNDLERVVWEITRTAEPSKDSIRSALNVYGLKFARYVLTDIMAERLRYDSLASNRLIDTFFQYYASDSAATEEIDRLVAAIETQFAESKPSLDKLFEAEESQANRQILRELEKLRQEIQHFQSQ